MYVNAVHVSLCTERMGLCLYSPLSLVFKQAVLMVVRVGCMVDCLYGPHERVSVPVPLLAISTRHTGWDPYMSYR